MTYCPSAFSSSDAKFSLERTYDPAAKTRVNTVFGAKIAASVICMACQWSGEASGGAAGSASRARSTSAARTTPGAEEVGEQVFRVEAAEIPGAHARRGARRALRAAACARRRRPAGADRRQLIEHVFDPGRAGKLYVLVGNDRDRSSGLEVRLRNARTGDDDVAARRDGLTLG